MKNKAAAHPTHTLDITTKGRMGGRMKDEG